MRFPAKAVTHKTAAGSRLLLFFNGFYTFKTYYNNCRTTASTA